MFDTYAKASVVKMEDRRHKIINKRGMQKEKRKEKWEYKSFYGLTFYLL